MIFCFLLALLIIPPADGNAAPTGTTSLNSATVCEDFAKRQVGIADRLIEQGNYTKSLKVIDRTLDNCDKDFVRDKLVEVFDAWFNEIRSSNAASKLNQFNSTLAGNEHLSSDQKSSFDNRIQSYVIGLIRQEFERENYQDAFQKCRSYSSYTGDSFRAKYYCGTSARELGANQTAARNYRWLFENWNGGQSLITRNELSTSLQNLYSLTGRFRSAYELNRELAVRDSSAEAVLSSLVSVRAILLAPFIEAGSIFLDSSPSDSPLSHVDSELRRVKFPKYVTALYLLAEDREVTRGVHGKEANPPPQSLLDQTSGSVSLLQSSEGSKSWLVSSTDAGYFVLEFGTKMTPEETTRLENVYENVSNDDKWARLFQYEFKETSPTTGSGVATLLSGAYLGNASLSSYNGLFDDSQLLNYYCIQGESEEVEEEYRFSKANLDYEESTWSRTSSTPALYHHEIKYDGNPLREVIWPTYVDDEWSGVVRVGLSLQ